MSDSYTLTPEEAASLYITARIRRIGIAAIIGAGIPRRRITRRTIFLSSASASAISADYRARRALELAAGDKQEPRR